MIKSASLFSQLLHVFPRSRFEALVRQHEAEYGAKGFSCWSQLVAMLFCQLARADSLREICNGLACCLGKLVHLGIARAPNKSTLAYANAKRPAKLYEDLFWQTAAQLRTHGAVGARKRRFRFKNKLLSLDASTITLCLNLFPWASFRTKKGGIKLHVLLDHDDYMPAYILITEARQHECKMAQHLTLNPGSVVVMDRGYCDYGLFGMWDGQGVFFVTRMKQDTPYEVIEQRTPPQERRILADEIIRLTGITALVECPDLVLRRVVLWDQVHQSELVLLTNHLKFGASTVAAIYKDRWEIELFFKALKQNLKVKTFVGTSQNALRIQIWTALLALLLLKWLHHLSRASWSFSNLVTMLRFNLFTHRVLAQWLHDPCGIPPPEPDPLLIEQLLLPLTHLGQPSTV
jgi:hypothetical protein